MHLRVPTCRERRVRLVIRDETGRMILRATREDSGISSGSRIGSEWPPWCRGGPRPPSGSVRACGRGRDGPKEIVAGPHGFELGAFEDVRTRVALPDGGVPESVWVRCDAALEGETVPLELFVPGYDRVTVDYRFATPFPRIVLRPSESGASAPESSGSG